jgi:hypothetical protein
MGRKGEGLGGPQFRAAAVGLSVVGVLAIVIVVIQLIVLLINGPDPLTRAAGLNPFWATLIAFGSSVALGLGLRSTRGVSGSTRLWMRPASG